MEYPFKDLLPLDEVLEREGYYKDWTHLDPEVFYSLTQISEYIKTKGYGVDVRLLIAQLAEHFGLKTTQVVDLANLLQQQFTNLEGVTQSFTNNINSLVAQMEADKDAVIANATVDSEVILARGGKPTLQARLDETTAQLAQTDFMEYRPNVFDEFSERGVNVKWFGAKGNANYYNSVDNLYYEDPDFEILSNDDSDAIQAAIDWVSNIMQQWNISGNWFSGSMGNLFFPNGKYWVRKEVKWKALVNIVGETRYGVVFNGYNNVNEYVFSNIEVSTPENIHHRTGNISNCTFIGSGIYLLRNSMASIKEVSFFNVSNSSKNKVALLLQLTVGIKLYDVQFFGCNRGFVINGNAGTGPSTSLYLDKVWAAHCIIGAMISFNINYLVTSSIIDSIFEYNGTGIVLSGNLDLKIEKIHFEQNEKNIESTLRSGANIKMSDLWSDSGTFVFLSAGESDSSKRHKVFIKNIKSVSNLIIQNGSFVDLIDEDRTTLLPTIPESARLFNSNGHLLQNSPPTSLTYKKGQRVETTGPSSSGDIGFVCIVAGTPGTWSTLGKVQ